MAKDAPVIFFDIIETWAVSVGMGHLDLAVTLVEPDATPAKTTKLSVAHLGFPLAMLPALKRAIEQIELVEKPTVGKA